VFQFNTDSWHFKVVMYVFGEEFFTEVDDIDFEIFRISRKVVWTRKPKVVNFCPYCRAVVAGTMFIPLIWLWRKLPHKEKEPKPYDHKKSMRNFRIVRWVFIVGLSGYAIWHLVHGEYGWAIIQAVVVSFQFWSQPLFKRIGKWSAKREEKKREANKKKTFVRKKNPSLLMTYLKMNHEKICPSIAFVDPNDDEVRV